MRRSRSAASKKHEARKWSGKAVSDPSFSPERFCFETDTNTNMYEQKYKNWSGKADSHPSTSQPKSYHCENMYKYKNLSGKAVSDPSISPKKVSS